MSLPARRPGREERIRIADLLRVRTSIREIGRKLGRPSCQTLQSGTDHRSLCVEFPDRDDMYLCAETIYQDIYDPEGSLRPSSPRPRRTGRLRRRPHRSSQPTNRFVEPTTMIDQRPDEVDDRRIPGHWEGDLIVGQGSRSAIGRLVERTTRFTILIHLNRQRWAEKLKEAMIAAFLALPVHLRRSLTWYQGIEMACHGEFSRGTNENTNGLLRDSFPKSTDLVKHNPGRLVVVADELNDRPPPNLA